MEHIISDCLPNACPFSSQNYILDIKDRDIFFKKFIFQIWKIAIRVITFSTSAVNNDVWYSDRAKYKCRQIFFKADFKKH